MNQMNRSLFFLCFLILCSLMACQNPPHTKDNTSPTEVKNQSSNDSGTDGKKETHQADTETANQPSIEENIQFIKDKYGIIVKSIHYKTIPFETQCDERTTVSFERKYNEKGALTYMQLIECGEHGCSTKQHYYWDGELIFIFHKNDYTPGVSHIIEEYRTYFKNSKMIRCLEKTASSYPGQASAEELLKKAPNQEVDCASDKLTVNLSELESLTTEKAISYFCGASTSMIGVFYSTDCSEHFDIEPFTCECAFKTEGGNKKSSIFVSDLDKKACIKVNGQLNALYPDREERDYKNEFKKLSATKHWITVNNKGTSYFGKPLKEYKYEDPIEFLIDVILASGKDITDISIQGSTENETVKRLQIQTQKAIEKAKEYKANGGDEPLTILKMGNRTYDIFVRYRQITKYEGEANKYEGKITLLKNRGKEILETRLIHGSCGC